MRIRSAALSDVGLIRINNEDAYCQFEPKSEIEREEKGSIFIVADGMGGHSGGEVASRLAVDTVRNAYYTSKRKSPAKALQEAFAQANSKIIEEAIRNTSLFGMGTTCTAVVIVKERAYFCHVGDSRAYHLRGGVLKQITRDHSLVGDMVRLGMISQEEARVHPQRNIITRSLGANEGTLAESPSQPLTLEKGDIILLCTDGLTSLVSDDEIQKVLEEAHPEEACRDLIAKANAQGGKDNITVQVIHIGLDANDE